MIYKFTNPMQMGRGKLVMWLCRDFGEYRPNRLKEKDKGGRACHRSPIYL